MTVAKATQMARYVSKRLEVDSLMEPPVTLELARAWKPALLTNHYRQRAEV
jgi:hypothetical protein